MAPHSSERPLVALALVQRHSTEVQVPSTPQTRTGGVPIWHAPSLLSCSVGLNMVPGRVAKLKAEIETPETRQYTSNPNPGKAFSLASSIPPLLPEHSESKSLPESSVPDYSTAHGITSSTDPHGSVDKSDTVIAVMGSTGSGKSSFVNNAAGRIEIITSYDLKSQTRSVQPIRCAHPDGHRNIVLVDTPGFDDTYLSDTQILKIIANWLKETYENNIKLTGILYLHRISDIRMGGTPLRNLAVFKDLCGDGNLKNVVLVTTMWDEIDQVAGSKREEELRSKYWKDMIQLGSDTRRFQGTRESAWEIIERLDLDETRQTRTPLQIQREMVDRRLPFHETVAAKSLLGFLATEFKKVWVRTRNGIRVSARRPTTGQRRHTLDRTFTIESHISETSIVSTNTSIDPSHSASILSPAESTSTGRSDNDRQALSGMITGLMLAYQVADMARIPVLRGAIGTVLQIAQATEGMGGTHPAIRHVIEYSAWLLEEITQFAAARGVELTNDMKKTLRSFHKELKKLQMTVKKILNRSYVARFLLHDVDAAAITARTIAIRTVYDKLQVRLAIDNRQATARLEEQLRTLMHDIASRQRVREGFLIREEAEESQPSSTSQVH